MVSNSSEGQDGHSDATPTRGLGPSPPPQPADGEMQTPGGPGVAGDTGSGLSVGRRVHTCVHMPVCVGVKASVQTKAIWTPHGPGQALLWAALWVFLRRSQ